MKRPQLRVRVPSSTTPLTRPIEGVVYDILKQSTVTRPVKNEVFACQNADVYVKLLKRNYEYYGVPFKKPNVVESSLTPKYIHKDVEKHIENPDQIRVVLNVLKSGKVRVKIFPQVAQLWETYYSKNKKPLFKSIVAAYKSIGYSENFIQNMQENYKKRQLFKKKCEKILENIFDKSVTSRKKIVKPKIVEKKEEDDIEEEEEEEELEEEPEEDEAIVEEDDIDEDPAEDVCPDDFD